MIFESSHIALNKVAARGLLALLEQEGHERRPQLHRMLGVTYNSAWFMAHRIRYAMQQPPFTDRMKGVVEVDETYVGGKPRRSRRYQYPPLEPIAPDKRRTGRGTETTPVVGLVERGGIVRSAGVANVIGDALIGVIREHVDPSAR